MGDLDLPSQPDVGRLDPGRVVVNGLLIAIGLGLLFAPFLFPDVRSQEVAARICVFIVLAASYDLLIGYTGIVSFAHTMFFGLGSYGVAIALKSWGPSWPAIVLGAASGVALSIVLAAMIGLLSLRVKSIFFAMVTLAVGSMTLVVASQLSEITGGEDGMTFQVPHFFSPAFKLAANADGSTLRLLGARLDGKLLLYYFVFASAAILLFLMLRIVASPLGTVLKAIRENDTRAEAIGYRVVTYRTAIFCIAAVIAAVAGVLWALWLQYAGPQATLSFSIMIDILLMVVIGGMGTILGSIIGVVLMTLAQFYLQDLMRLATAATQGIPGLPQVFNPDRWLLWLGLAFILLVYFSPAGIVGTLTKRDVGR